MNVTQTDRLAEVSRWLEELRDEFQQAISRASPHPHPDKFGVGFTVKGCQTMLHNIDQAQQRLKYAGVPVAAQPLDKVYEGEEYGVKGAKQ